MTAYEIACSLLDMCSDMDVSDYTETEAETLRDLNIAIASCRRTGGREFNTLILALETVIEIYG